MSDPNNFKLDVRVRERMLARGQITEDEIKKHLDALPDAEQQGESIQQPQPALGSSPGAEPPQRGAQQTTGGSSEDDDLEAS